MNLVALLDVGLLISNYAARPNKTTTVTNHAISGREVNISSDFRRKQNEFGHFDCYMLGKSLSYVARDFPQLAAGIVRQATVKSSESDYPFNGLVMALLNKPR